MKHRLWTFVIGMGCLIEEAGSGVADWGMRRLNKLDPPDRLTFGTDGQLDEEADQIARDVS